MKDGAPENSIMFFKRGGFSYIKEWIESLILSEELHQSTQYLTKILELSGIILFNIGDLDCMPFANDIVEILVTYQYHEEFHMSKRDLLVSFVASQIDDKNLRLDLKRTNVSYYFDDILSLSQKVLKMFNDLP